MNLTDCPPAPDIKDSIKLIPRAQWIGFFSDIRALETARLMSSPLQERDLTDLQARVKLIKEMEEFFLQIHQSK